MRPNLMSPRRTSGEDSILAMLERDPARKRAAGAVSRTRLAWYGASAAVAIALTGTLVWLAAGNDGLHPELARSRMADVRSAVPAPAAAVRPAPALVQVALGADSTPAARSASAALIVDQTPQDEPPPLRLLKPGPEKAPKPPAPPVAAVAKPAARAVPPAPAPAAAAQVRSPAASPAAPARPRPATVARNAARPAPSRAQRPSAPARAEGPVDPDVALISAVIVHANGHAPEGSQMTELLCPNDSCQPKPARQ